MNGYVIPREVDEDFQTFGRQHADFLAGRMDAAVFRTHRVPFGIYEQRETGTFMVRARLAGGRITPAQLAALSGLAERYGDGRIHVTTRGGAQLHHVAIENALAVMTALREAGLTTRGGGGNTVRGITADPLAGVAADEAFDVTPHALALTGKMLAQKDSYALPRKFKIAFSGSPADRGGAVYADVGFVAQVRDGQRGFRAYVGGGMGANFRLGEEFADFLPEDEIFLLAQAVKEVFDAHGNRRNKHAARLRFLVEELGFPAFRELARERIGIVRRRGDWRLAIAPSPEKGARRADGAQTPPFMESRRPEERRWFRRFALPQKQAMLYAAKIPLPLGDLSASGARALAEALTAVAPDETDLLRFSADQCLYLRNLSADALFALHPALEAISPLAAKPALLGDIVVCAGALTCQLGVTVPRGAAAAIEKTLEKSGLDLDALQGLRIHLSGCPNSCGRHAIADLGFFGKVLRNDGVPYPAYNVFAGARTGEGAARFARPVGEVAAFHLPAFVADALRAWLPAKDSQACFADWIDGDGEAVIAELAKKYAAVPAFDDDKNPYFDFSCKELFSLKGRGAGECSAGMYDLIETDRKALSAALKAADTPENLARIRLLAARMLLVTRGEEARGEKEVLGAFAASFVRNGLIDPAFAPLLEGGVAIGQADELRRLARAVIDLYATMDNTLKFAAERSAPAETPAAPPLPTPAANGAAPRFKDYRGVACPMNFVKTKMDLARMQSGQILEILLDDGAPIDNVPRSVRSEGHEVLAQTKEGAAWRVRIRKAATN
ncbi:MAG: sulfurtransferase TusA family protein [Candidatus Accumulibacter sp.]|jgi:sulfite reductase (ferredoxin)|nr:sulfurtransferase TusA family protein [Accumulibacter sp.]